MQKNNGLIARGIRNLLNTKVGKAVAAELAASPITDDNFFPHGLSKAYTDRTEYDRDKILAECLRAWRVQPLARRIVKIITAFVIGAGFGIKSDHKATQAFLQKWWTDTLNNFDEQLPEWLDERTRSGNIFALASVDTVTGMTYWRAIPADQIKEIKYKNNDVRQETFYIPHELETKPWEAYDPNKEQEQFVIHHAIDRPVGTPWGEPPLAPLLPWIGRYSAWLEDRVRLNRFRNAFMYIVRGQFQDDGAKKRRQIELNTTPPQPGSILVTDPSEDWGILSANLDSFDASVDGQAVKTHISAGIGFPMHWFGEGESSTRTTAEAAGTPTFKSLEQEQTSFVRFIQRMAEIAVTIRKQYDSRVNPQAKIEISKPDITERDNANLSLAVSRIYPVVADLFDRKGMDEAELLRLIYRMAGEAYDQNINAPTMTRRPLKAIQTDSGTDTNAPAAPADPKTDPTDTPTDQGDQKP